MLRYLIDALDFVKAVRCVAGLTALTCLYSFIFATPNPDHDHHEPKKWLSKRTWFDTDVKTNKAFWWFTAAVAFMFFGFYPVFFNVEEVSTITATTLQLLTPSSGQLPTTTARETGLAKQQIPTATITHPSRPSGSSPS